jgi:benzylsuccinate CoA-transferase BbsF subunit
MQLMQAAGVPAGIVQNAQDIIENDPQLKERDFLVQLEHPELGVFGHPTPAYKLQKTRFNIRTSPLLGENTEYVCTQLLGMNKEEFRELFDDGVFT